MDVHTKNNIEMLVTLLAMELQFMRGCDVDWKKNDEGLSPTQPPRAALSPDNKDDDDVAKDDADGNEREAGSMSGDKEIFDFMSIDLMGIETDGRYLCCTGTHCAKPTPSTATGSSRRITWLLGNTCQQSAPNLNPRHCSWRWRALVVQGNHVRSVST